MDEEEDIDIAAAMGFGSFGSTKKRKFEHTTSPRAAVDASGANSTQLGIRAGKSENTSDEVPADSEAQESERRAATGSSAHFNNVPSAAAAAAAGDHSYNDTTALETVSFGGPPITKRELNALKFGVSNSEGDMAYFLPNFVEDPWARLIKAGT